LQAVLKFKAHYLGRIFGLICFYGLIVLAIARFEDIKAWQAARELTGIIYTLTGKETFSRDYGLKDRIQRASGSVR